MKILYWNTMMDFSMGILYWNKLTILEYYDRFLNENTIMEQTYYIRILYWIVSLSSLYTSSIVN